MVETLSGDRGVLAHVALPGPPRVGRYGVDLQAFERIALPALAASQPGGVVVVDELGKMELASAAFRDVVRCCGPGCGGGGHGATAPPSVHRCPQAAA